MTECERAILNHRRSRIAQQKRPFKAAGLNKKAHLHKTAKANTATKGTEKGESEKNLWLFWYKAQTIDKLPSLR